MSDKDWKRSNDTWIAVVAILALLGVGYWAVTLKFAHGDLVEQGVKDRASIDTEKKASAGLKDQLDACQKDLGAANGKLSDATAAAAKAGDSLTASQASLTASQAELNELRAQHKETEARIAAFKAVADKLKAMINAGKLRVHVRNGQLVVELPAALLFPSGSAELSKDGETAVRDVAAILKQFPDRRFMVAGHTDNVPIGPSTFKDNWELSAARAVNVTEMFVKAGMNPAKLVAAGYGQYDPIANNASEQGRASNRRIEVVLLPNVAELPAMADALATTK